MINKKLLLQLVFFAALAVALPANVPAISPMDCSPQPPLLPVTFTGAFSERLTIDGEVTWLEGYYYYSDLVEAVQVDYTLPNAIGSSLIAGGEWVTTQISGGQYLCMTDEYPLPFLGRDALQSFDFLGVSLSPRGEVLYAWGREFFGHTLVVMTNADTGALAAEYTDNMALTWQSFEEGIPDNVFQATCHQTLSSKSTLARETLVPGSFLTGSR